jgi:hypothetical protein
MTNGNVKRWNVYYCEVSGRPAQVIVNTHYPEEPPFEQLPFPLWFAIYCNKPPGPAFWDPDETELLDEIEDDLLATVASWKQGCVFYSLRIATPGLREYYIYAKDADGLQSIIDEIRAQNPTYRLDGDAMRDESWERYRTFFRYDDSELPC